MPSEWCNTCCTRHPPGRRCPEQLNATDAERHGWRVNVESPAGIEAYGVLVAAAGDRWRARILTYPNVLWLVPGGAGTMKFLADTPQLAELQAIEFIREHCRTRGLGIRREEVREIAAGLPRGASPAAGNPAPRKIRFLPLRFGLANPSEPGGVGNLSESGLFVITGTPISRGTEVRLLLMLSTEDLSLRGQVRWMRDQPHVGRSPGMGVQLVQPPPSYIRFVRGLA